MRELARLGVDLRLSAGKNGGRGVQHNKLAVIDGKLVQTGSYNWTTNAHKNNYENVLFLDAPDDAAAYAAYFDRVWEQGWEPEPGDFEASEFAPEGAVPAPGATPW
jgi:phosphatidylserine/phosphatidylglycerophosphate/cardiolipin synthase-like enzyme